MIPLMMWMLKFFLMHGRDRGLLFSPRIEWPHGVMNPPFLPCRKYIAGYTAMSII